MPIGSGPWKQFVPRVGAEPPRNIDLLADTQSGIAVELFLILKAHEAPRVAIDGREPLQLFIKCPVLVIQGMFRPDSVPPIEALAGDSNTRIRGVRLFAPLRGPFPLHPAF